jgi:hypothetical protein
MTPASEPKKSRSRQRGLTETEEKILRAVNELHIVDAESITRLLSTKKACSHYSKLLTKLAGGADFTHTSYLLRFGMPHAPGNFRRLYTLTRRGAAFLRELGVEADWWYMPKQASHNSFTFLTHQLSIAKFLVALSAFVRDYPEYELVETRTSYTMEKNPPTFTLVVGEREIKASVIFDAWAYISHPDREHALGIEIDAGSEARQKYQQLVLNRIEFIKSGQYEAYFHTPSVLLCYLVVGASRDYRISRLHTIREWVHEVLTKQQLTDWASVFRFSTLDESVYDTHMLFTDPVWLRADTTFTLVNLLTD